ncbi:MAG: hypothetical protein NUV47_01300 [Patescibacteria group bacterium]|nr:hypothetical protein [Patescibacteria group bacterium]
MKSKPKRVIVLTCKDDPSADFVIKKIKEQNLAFKRINMDEIRNSGYFSFRPTTGIWELYDGSTTITPEEVGVVWQRRVPRRVIKHDNQLISEYLTQEWRLCWEWWLNQIPVEKVLDTESALKIASNKMLQLKRAVSMGFKIPETLVTSNPNEYKIFIQTHKNVVAKTLGGFGRILEEDKAFGTIYTNRLEHNVIPNEATLRAAPMILQTEIEKEYELRITVVDNAIFSCRIDSQMSTKTQVDWRRYDFGNVPHFPITLPAVVEKNILKFMESFSIHFASFDLAVTPQGEYIFFEMNPNSQWVWIEHFTSLPITDSLVKAFQRRCVL